MIMPSHVLDAMEFVASHISIVVALVACADGPGAFGE